MAVRKKQHVVPFGNGWAVVPEGRKTVTVITTRQSQAISFAKDVARQQKTGVVVHGRNGMVRERHSYANVPQPARG